MTATTGARKEEEVKRKKLVSIPLILGALYALKHRAKRFPKKKDFSHLDEVDKALDCSRKGKTMPQAYEEIAHLSIEERITWASDEADYQQLRHALPLLGGSENNLPNREDATLRSEVIRRIAENAVGEQEEKMTNTPEAVRPPTNAELRKLIARLNNGELVNAVLAYKQRTVQSLSDERLREILDDLISKQDPDSPAPWTPTWWDPNEVELVAEETEAPGFGEAVQEDTVSEEITADDEDTEGPDFVTFAELQQVEERMANRATGIRNLIRQQNSQFRDQNDMLGEIRAMQADAHDRQGVLHSDIRALTGKTEELSEHSAETRTIATRANERAIRFENDTNTTLTRLEEMLAQLNSGNNSEDQS